MRDFQMHNLVSVAELYAPVCVIASCLRCRFGRQAVGSGPAYIIPAHRDLSTLWVGLELFLISGGIRSGRSLVRRPCLL